MRRLWVPVFVIAITRLGHADHASPARFGVGAGVRVDGDDVEPAVLARVAWEDVALEPTLAIGVGKTRTNEEALGYEAEADDRHRTVDVGLGLRFVVARRERLSFGVLARAAAGYTWQEARGDGPADDFAVRATHVGFGAGLRVEWEAFGPLTLLVDAQAELLGWSKVEHEGNNLVTTDRGWSSGVSFPGVVSAIALITF